jgi:hypothetical protein
MRSEDIVSTGGKSIGSKHLENAYGQQLRVGSYRYSFKKKV